MPYCNKNENIVKLLLSFGADVNAEDDMRRTALHLAAPFGSIKKIKMLLDAGANPNALTKYGISPLHGAAGWNKDPEVIVEIIKAGGNVNSGIEFGRTPLHEAGMWNSNSKVIFALIDMGADIFADNNKGENLFDIIETNERLKSTDGYWDVRELQFR